MINADVITRILILIVLGVGLVSQVQVILVYPRGERKARALYNLITIMWLIHAVIFYTVAVLYHMGYPLMTNAMMGRWVAGLMLHIGLSVIVKERVHIARYDMERSIDGRD